MALMGSLNTQGAIIGRGRRAAHREAFVDSSRWWVTRKAVFSGWWGSQAVGWRETMIIRRRPPIKQTISNTQADVKLSVDALNPGLSDALLPKDRNNPESGQDENGDNEERSGPAHRGDDGH